MKGVILAGGVGARLNPLTEITNKHLLTVGKEPMIWHPIRQMVLCGIQEILVVTSTHHMGDIVNSLGSGRRFGCHFTYKVQEEAGGIAQALALAERFAESQPILVLLGDNIFEHSIAEHVAAFRKQKKGARVLLKEVGDPERFGIAALDEKHVISIEEKPKQPKSNYAVVGCYMYDRGVFEIIRAVKPSKRGELEITDVNNAYIKKRSLKFGFVKGRWTDAGTFESLIEANELLLSIDNRIMDG
ncbi:MAG: NTP transferase domain-containing protein [Planctomycetota bacterium]|nr:NTP transferase domain-containing protein [Planctomycetota bacterium]